MQIFIERYRSLEKLLNREQEIEIKSPTKRKSSLHAKLLMKSSDENTDYRKES